MKNEQLEEIYRRRAGDIKIFELLDSFSLDLE